MLLRRLTIVKETCTPTDTLVLNRESKRNKRRLDKSLAARLKVPLPVIEPETIKGR